MSTSAGLPLPRGTDCQSVLLRSALRKQSGPALLWGLLFFAAMQAGYLLLVQFWRPELRDPEYGYKRTCLLDSVRAEPDRPLVLVLGSSRSEMGFRPDVLNSCRTPSGQTPLVFNFGLAGSGPVQELLCLERVLADGIRPSCVLIEILPPLLQETSEADRLPVPRLTWSDLARIRDYSFAPGQLYSGWLQAALAPAYEHRFNLLGRYVPSWLAWEVRQDHLRNLDRTGWLTYPRECVSDAYRRHEIERAAREYVPRLQHFAIADRPDRALRDLLALCRREGITAALFIMPEGSEFRSWYSPAVNAAIGTYLARLSREAGVPLIDARTWIEDDLSFVDSHHLFPRGAAAFTRRFEREALQPLLEGRHDD